MSAECRFCECIKFVPQKRGKFKECPNHLENWEKWLKVRRETQEILKKKTGRSQGELLMNLSEELRQIQEEKLVFTYSQINTNFDRLRGNPEFWKLPVGLAEKSSNLRDPIYFTIKTKEEKNEVPQIEYICTPNTILDEKHVLPRTRNIYNKWKNNAYRNSRIERISSKLSLIQPHLPDISKLMVKGKKLSLEDTSKRKKDLKETEQSGNYQHSYSNKISFEVHQIPDISFTINEVEFPNENQSIMGQQSIRLLFSTEDLQNTPVTRRVKFENKGTKTMRFYWHKLEKFRTFRDITPDRPHIDAFYFDKTEILLVPGRKFQLPIWFKPKETGNYAECWEIKTTPNIWNEDFKFIVRMQGIVTDENIEERCRAIKVMLDNNVRDTLIKDILNESMIRIRYPESKPIVYSFSEKELFESTNQEISGISKKTKYLYDPNLVSELKEFYNKVKNTGDSADDWDYSIERLKVLAREKDVVEYVVKLTEDCARSRNRLLELDGFVEQSETGPNNEIVVGNDEPAETIGHYEKLQDLLQKLERPAMIPNTEREKFLHAYFIINTYFSKMCVALDSLDGYAGDILKSYQPFYDFRRISGIENLPSRLVIERFDDIWVERTKRAPTEPQTGFTMAPKPKCLETIPVEDTTTVFKTYFKKTPQKSDNKAKKSAKKPVPLKKEITSKSKQASNVKISQTIMEGPIRENFDPFGDIESLYPAYTTIFDESIVSSSLPAQEVKSVNNMKQKTDGYDYRKYLIVYTSLCSAVDAMVASLETLKKPVVPVATFAKIYKVPANKRRKSENFDSSCSDPYFQYLLNTHLIDNQATNEYFIQGRTAPSIEEISALSEREEPSVVEELPNLFKSHETLVVEPIESRSTLISRGAQTSFSDVDLGVVLEDLLKIETSDSLEVVEKSEEPNDIFYFMDNEKAEKLSDDAE